MDNLTTQVQTLSEDIFAQLMDEVPAGSVNPNSLMGSSKPQPQEPKEEVKEEKKGKDESKNKEESTKGKLKVEEEPGEEKQLTEEEFQKNLNKALGEDDSDEDDEPKDKGSKDKGKSTEKLDKDTSGSILQTQAQMLIDAGVWEEFEGMEEFEWTNENYAELVRQQNQWSLEKGFSELLDATGPYGKAIISHIQNGGNPEEIIDLFKEAKKIENFDVSTEEGKVALLTQYYKDLGWSDKRIKRTIDSAIDTNSIDEDVAEAKEEMEEAIKAQVQEKQKAQQEYLDQQREAQEKFAENITNTLRERKDISMEQKREIATSLLVYDKKLPDGRVVNQFALDFAKLQSDPKKYVDLVMFVRDYDKFKENISKQEEKKAVKKAWEFVKGNGAAAKTGGASHVTTKGKDKSDLVIDYRAFN